MHHVLWGSPDGDLGTRRPQLDLITGHTGESSKTQGSLSSLSRKELYWGFLDGQPWGVSTVLQYLTAIRGVHDLQCHWGFQRNGDVFLPIITLLLGGRVVEEAPFVFLLWGVTWACAYFATKGHDPPNSDVSHWGMLLPEPLYRHRGLKVSARQ